MNLCYCTLAIHAPYRRRARELCRDLAPAPMVVLTDDPSDFADLPVEAILHHPTGPMAVDYQQSLMRTGGGRGQGAYHDKRFALQKALDRADTAVFLDADTRIHRPLPTVHYPRGLAALPVVRRTLAEHLDFCGTWRRPALEKLAVELTGDSTMLNTAVWCHESCLALTRDGKIDRFFEAWDLGAERMQSWKVFSGEGGVIGLAAAYAGWTIDFEVLVPLEACLTHECTGPKTR